MKICDKCGACIDPNTGNCNACKGTGVQPGVEPAEKKKKK